MRSCAEFARLLERAAIKARNEIDIPTEAVVASVATEAKAVLGTYAFDWPQLAESTQADRVRKGFPANQPLLRTGQLRVSIEHEAELSGVGAVGAVYSNDKIAAYQEIGTKRGIPPRSFIMQSLVRCAPAAEIAFKTFFIELFTLG